MMKIVLIGCGQLGSRYLQSFLNPSYENFIQILEPNVLSRNNAENLVSNILLNKNKYVFINTIDEIIDNPELIIIATSSDVRYKILKELIEKKTFSKIILEKVLFQKTEEYYNALELIEKNNIQCWVNHTRRMFPFYHKIKQILKGSRSLSFSINGGNWGMACNALHFLDCIEFLTEETIEQIDCSLLNCKLYPSKRKDFFEINGKIIGRTKKSIFSLVCIEDFSPMSISICTDKTNIIIDEICNNYFLKEQNTEWNNFQCFQEKICYFQSELGTMLLEDILNNSCKLPLYKDSMRLHVQFIESLMEHINSFSVTKYSYCPIT
ncbi:dehydrogenase [Campylobacter lari]|nr:dehydrogenase [Campylobacter lari]EDP6894394.1 dehydrogenase [Campylobacter lari]